MDRNVYNMLYHHGVKGMKWGKQMSKKEIREAAQDTINGKYGNGAERKKELGEHYDEIQSKVNSILGVNKESKKKSNALDKKVQDVIKGKYGNGAERKKKLGKEYQKVQDKVNDILLHNNKKSIKDVDRKKLDAGKKYVSKKLGGKNGINK